MENPLDSILVVCCSKDLLNDQLSSSRDNSRFVPKVCMFKQDSVILFMDTYSIIDVTNAAVAGGELGIQVANVALAVAAKFQAVCHVSCTVFT